MSDRITRIILLSVEGGKRKRYELTNRLKNYPKGERDEAIRHCISNQLIKFRASDTGMIGRSPTYVEITDAGRERLNQLGRVLDSENTIWIA